MAAEYSPADKTYTLRFKQASCGARRLLLPVQATARRAACCRRRRLLPLLLLLAGRRTCCVPPAACCMLPPARLPASLPCTCPRALLSGFPSHPLSAQTIKPTPGQPTKDPVLIPVRMGLLAPDGGEVPLKLRG